MRSSRGPPSRYRHREAAKQKFLRDGCLGLKPEAALDSCAAPVLGNSTLAVTKNENFPTVGKLQMDLLTMALACELTRVGSIMWNRSVGGATHTWADPTITAFQQPLALARAINGH